MAIATAGLGGADILAPILILGVVGMLVAAGTCWVRRSPRAGIVVIAIVLVQAAILRPWRAEAIQDPNDYDQVAEAESAKQAGELWILASMSALGIVIAAWLRKRNQPNKAPEPTAMSVTSPAAQEPRQP